MFVSNHDNLKISVSGNSVFVINNNSNVYLDLNINTDIDIASNKKTINSTLATVTFNKGNTINNLSQTSVTTYFNNEEQPDSILDYDIVYSNSVVYTKQKNWSESQQEFLTEYNFPAAKWKVNGYKSNYAILLNNGINPKWTSLDKGVLIGNIEVDNIQQLPTRLNGYTATIQTLNTSLIDKKYNGTIKIDNLRNTLTANFVYNLQIQNYISPSSPTTFNFSNITYLSIKSILNTDVVIKNVRYSVLRTQRKVIIQNSNIVINNLDQISTDSYNTTISFNVNDSEYKNYLLSGTLVNRNFGYKNVLFNKLKFLKQLSHPINESEGYSSNTPIGSIVWYPLAWSSFDPAVDKNSLTNPDKSILLRGEPTTTDWELCDGHIITDSNSLYRQLYKKITTPNYKVLETPKGSPNAAGTYHFLQEPSVIQFLPSTIFNFYIASANGTIRQTGGNLHNRSLLTVTQNLQDGSISMGIGCSQWQAHSYINCIFSVNVALLHDAGINLKDEFAILFDSPCCAGGGPNGDAWWHAWTGGSINALSSRGYLPTSDENGNTWTTNSAAENHTLYIGGWPAAAVTGYCKGTQAWLDTLNTPKLAMIVSSTVGDYFDLLCVNGKLSGLRLFANTVNTLWRQRAGYVNCPDHNVSRSRGKKNSRKIRLCCDTIHADNLPYLWKTWRIKFKTDNIPDSALTNGILTGMLRLQITIPTIYALLRSKSNDVIYRWSGAENRDGDDSQRLYKMYYAVRSVPVFKNLKCRYVTEVIPAKISRNDSANITTISQTWNWGTHHTGYNSVNWPQRLKSAKDAFRLNGSFYNYGLFRRLNPYIKVNDNNITKDIIIDQEDDFNKTPIIKIRHNFRTNRLLTLNLNKISGDTLSSCYIADNWDALSSNVLNFYYKIDNLILDGIQNKTTAYLQFLNENEADGTVNGNRKVCNVYKVDNTTYIKCGESSEDFKKIFPVSLITDEDGYTSETYNYLNDLTYELQLYKSKDAAIGITNRSVINYTIYSVSYDEFKNTYNLRINNDLLKLSNCNRMLLNTVNYIDNYLTTLSGTGNKIKEYYNTCSSHLPVFWRNDIDELNNNNSENINTYYYLGTNNQVMSATNNVNNYVFKYTHDVQTDPENPEIVTYNSLSALIHTNTNKMNIVGNFYKRSSTLEPAGADEILSTNTPLTFESFPATIQILKQEEETEDESESNSNNYITLQYKKNTDSLYTECSTGEEFELIGDDTIMISGVSTNSNKIKLMGNENSDTITLQYSKNGGAWTNYTFGEMKSLDNGNTFMFSGNCASNSAIKLTKVGSPDNVTLLYKKGNSEWTSYTINDEIDMIGNETISFSGNNSYFSKTVNDYYQFQMTGALAANGSVQSLVNDSDSCTDACYANLFLGCTNLLIAPALPASTLAPSCYYNMFNGCNKITDAPILPAITLTDQCYENMFYGCTSLNSMNVKFTNWTDTSTLNWVKNVQTTAGDFKKPEDLTETRGVNKIPTNWIVIIDNKPITNPPLSEVSALLTPGESYTISTKVVIPSSEVNTQIYNSIKKCTQHLKNKLKDASNYTGFDSIISTQYDNYFSNFTNNPYDNTTYDIPNKLLVKLDRN